MKKIVKVGTIVLAVIGATDIIFEMAKVILCRVSPKTAGKMFERLGGMYIQMARPEAANNYEDPLWSGMASK